MWLVVEVALIIVLVWVANHMLDDVEEAIVLDNVRTRITVVTTCMVVSSVGQLWYL